MTRTAPLLGLVVLVAGLLPACRSTPVYRGTPCCNLVAPDAPTRVAAIHHRQIFIDMSIVRIPEADAKRLLGAHRPASTSQPTILTEAEAQALRSAWKDDASARVVQAPKMLTFHGQEGTLFIGESMRFAKSEATRTDGGLTFAITDDPLGPVQMGQSIRVTPTTNEDGSRIALAMHQAWREAKSGFSPEESIKAGAATFVKDYTRGQSFDVALDLADGGSALLGDPTVIEDNEGRHVRMTLMTVRILVPTGGPN